MKGVIYTRVSSDEQIEGTSLDSQEEQGRKYCEQLGIAVVAVFREEGESAKDMSLKNRSQFLAALEFCRKKKDIAAFVVFKVDRFARHADDHFSVRRLLSTYGTSLHSVTEPIGNKPAEKFIETVLAGAAEYDNAIRKERCTGGMVARINQGIWPFRPPVGYACAHHRKHGEKKTVPDEPHSALFPIIQRGLRAYASGELVSQTALMQQLNLWGFETAFGKAATNQRVNDMLRRHLPFYTGKLVNPWTGAEQPGQHVPMISQDDAERIRGRLRGVSPTVPTKRTHFNDAFPLRRLLRCHLCGHFLTAAYASGNGGRYGYYYCINKTCAARSKGMRRIDLHSHFPRYLRRLCGRPGEHKELERRLRDIVDEKGGPRQSDHARAGQQLAMLSARRQRLFDMREDGSYDVATFKERLASVDQETAVLNAKMQETPRDLSSVDPDELVASARWLLSCPALWWQKLKTAPRPRFERIVFPDGIRYDAGGRFRTTKPGLIFALLRGTASNKSSKVVPDGINSNQLYDYFQELIALYHETKDTDTGPADVDVAA